MRETLTVMAVRWIDEAALQLLIGPPAAGVAPVNPDPAAMRRALLALRDALRAVRSR